MLPDEEIPTRRGREERERQQFQREGKKRRGPSEFEARARRWWGGRIVEKLEIMGKMENGSLFDRNVPVTLENSQDLDWQTGLESAQFPCANFDVKRGGVLLGLLPLEVLEFLNSRISNLLYTPPDPMLFSAAETPHGNVAIACLTMGDILTYFVTCVRPAQ